MIRLFLILFVFLAPSTFAQNLYVNVDRGSGTACSESEPCSLSQALTNASADDTIYILIRRSGDVFTIDGDYGPLDLAVNFAAYTRSSSEATSATLSFNGEFEVGESGKFLPHSKISAQFANLVIADGNSYPFGEESDDLGTIAISVLEAGFVTIHRLHVKSDLTIKRLETATSSPVITIEELEVSKGAVLTVGLMSNEDGSDRENPAHLRVPLRQAATADDNQDNLIVHGTINGAGSLLIAHDNNATGRGASDFNLHETEDYTPTGDKEIIDHTDCVTIEGDGEIRTDLYAIAAGNICISLKKIATLIVTGSIQADEYSTEMITTDVTFREDVEINGNVEQWNDAKIVFEKSSTIQGSVILDSGQFSYPVLTAITTGNNALTLGDPRDNFDPSATTGADLIVREVGMERSDQRSCWPTRRQTGSRTEPLEDPWISGIRFEGPSDIMNDLNLRHTYDDRDHEGSSRTDIGAAQRCLIAVDFWISRPALGDAATQNEAFTSRIGGDLLAENGGSINLSGHLFFTLTPTATFLYYNHHLQLDGDIIADGEFGLYIWEGNSSRYDAYRGECTSTNGTPDASTLLGASLFELTDKRDHRILLGDGNMRMFTLTINNKVRVQGGNLIAKGIHVKDGGQLISDENIQVGWSDSSVENSYWNPNSRFASNPDARGRLILEGDGLQGVLHTDSHVIGLTYASSKTDLLDQSLIQTGGHMVFHLQTGASMRLRDPLVLGSVGLCSGSVILEEPDEDDSNTLTINRFLYVKNGNFEFDPSRPGSLATDEKNETHRDAGYEIVYHTDGPRTIGNEWFGTPLTLDIDHKDAFITSEISRELPARVRIIKGELHVKGTLAVGTDSKMLGSFRRLTVEEGAVLRADTLRLHERMTVYGTVETDGGDIYAMGHTDDDGHYVNSSAEVYIRGKEGKIDLGDGGTLHLGPPLMEKQDGLIRPAGEDGMPFTSIAALSESKQPFKGNLNVTAGSKFNSVQFISHIDTLTFDGTPTPNLEAVSASNEKNLEGIVFFQNHNITDTGVVTLVDSLRIDSLAAHNGWVRFWNTPLVKITKNLDLSSAIVTFQSQAHLEGNVTIRDTGALTFDGTVPSFHPDADRFLKIDGDFHLMAGKPHPKNTYYMPPPSSGLSWALGASIPQTVMGDYRVDPDALQYAMAGSPVIVHGDLHFAYGRKGYEQLDAHLEFQGSSPQTITAASVPFGDVVINNPKGILLERHVSQAPDVTLTLRRGTIGGDSTWTVMNTTVEEDLVRRLNAGVGDQCGPNNNQACSASILRGSRTSYVSTTLARHLQYGVRGGQAPATGGYLFPLGRVEDTETYYRPLMLQFSDDLDSEKPVLVTLMQVPDGTTPGWPDNNILAPAQEETITLDVHADLFWKVESGDDTPLISFADVRVGADGLSNALVPERIRLVQWDCQWQNPRLAGQYNLADSTETEVFSANGYLGGILNITQESVDLGICTILGIAANSAENPIHQQQFTGGIAQIQLIHNAILGAPVDITLNGSPATTGIDFQSATRYRNVAAGSYEAVILPQDAPSSQAIKVQIGAIEEDQTYAFIAHGAGDKIAFQTLETRLTSSVDNMVEVRLVHGSADLGVVRMHTIDILADPRTASPVRLLVNNFGFDQVSNRYIQLSAGFHRVEVVGNDSKNVFDINLHGYQGRTFILNLSNTSDNLEIFAVDEHGPVNLATTVTGVDNAEIPTEFALHGNYPNPFNPSTRIQFDLPESAQVHLQLIDLLGREVMALPEKDFEAGVNRTIELNATNLASGTYLYRIIATGTESRYVKTGRMTLVK